MSLYTYKVLTENGELRIGETVSSSADELRQSLLEQGLLVQKINKKSQYRIPFFQRRESISLDEFLVFNQELIALLNAGLTLPESLSLIRQQCDTTTLGKYLGLVLSDIKGGMSFSRACEAYPLAFEKLYVSTLRTGEKTGRMAEVLSRYQNYLSQRNELKKKLSQAMAYPVFLLITFAIIMSVLFAFVVPRFVALYAGFSAEMPYATRILFGVVDHFPLYLAAIMILSMISWAAYRYWDATDEGGYRIDVLKTRLPVWGSLYTMQTYVQITRMLATLLYAGTPLVESMRIVAEALQNRVYVRRLTSAIRMVEEGESLAIAITENDLLPAKAAGMIKVGEATGSLDTMCDSVTEFYEGQLDIHLRKLMSLIEPALMLLMGLLVGSVIIVMYLPVFGMANILS